MQRRSLYKNGPKVGAIGLGAMSIGGFFGATDKKTSLEMLEKCVELEVTHIDTALIYGPYISETVIGEFLQGRSNPFHIATKGGISPQGRGIDNSEKFLRECLESSFERLGVDYVDLYYVHRREQDIPIEDVMGTLLKFKAEGKIGGIGFSEISPASLKRASTVGHVDAVQSEYSLWTRLPELGMLQTCEKLETTFVPFSPVARGMITDKGVDPSGFAEIDFRRTVPRFMEPNYSANLEIINQFKAYAKDNGYTSQALALAWVLRQDDKCIPIPGTRTAKHLEELVAGASINLSETQLKEIEEILPIGFAHGNRYSDAQQKPAELYC